MEIQKGQVYFLVEYIPSNGDYFFRRVIPMGVDDMRDDLKGLEGENRTLVSIPEQFLGGLSPKEIGKRLKEVYERRKSKEPLTRGNEVLRVMRYIDESGISLGCLEETLDKELTIGLARICLEPCSAIDAELND